MSKKVDILIPVYNGASSIEACLESVRNQTYKDINIIVLNDGSKDNTLDIIEKISKIDNRVKIYSKENEKSVSLARNYLLEKLESDYFIFIDADDYVSPLFIELLVKTIEDTNAELACCEFSFFKRNLSKTKKIKSVKLYNSKDAIPEFVLGMKRGHFMLWNKLIKRDLVKGLKFNSSLNYGEDLFYVLDILQNNDILVASIKNKLYYYQFFNVTSISKGGLNDKKKLFLETLIRYEEEKRYGDNTRVITAWIYLTCHYFMFLCKNKKENKEYKVFLRKNIRSRKNSIKYLMNRKHSC